MARNVTHSVAVMVVIAKFRDAELKCCNFSKCYGLDIGNLAPVANRSFYQTFWESHTICKKQNRAILRKWGVRGGVLGNGIPIAKNDAAFLINICTTVGVCFEKVLPRNAYSDVTRTANASRQRE